MSITLTKREPIPGAPWRRIMRRSLRIVAVVLAIYTTLIVLSNVGTDVTDADKAAFLAEGFLARDKPSNFDDQITIISDAQSKVLDKFPIGEGIPLFEEREPANLNAYRRGLCFDRSRYLDKLLQYKGFQTRHIYILYDTGESFIASLLTKGHPSHAVTQVLTERGWLVVDSNSKYLALDKNGSPISLQELEGENSELPESFQKKFWAIIGLYSRNGALYKPYLLVPELNIFDFLANFTSLSQND
jgi:hypothetical protein